MKRRIFFITKNLRVPITIDIEPADSDLSGIQRLYNRLCDRIVLVNEIFKKAEELLTNPHILFEIELENAPKAFMPSTQRSYSATVTLIHEIANYKKQFKIF